MSASRELADALTGFLGVYIPEKRRRQEDAKDEKRWNMMYELQRQNAQIAREQADMNRELHQAKMDDIKRTLDIRKRMGDYLESKDLPRDPEVIGLMTDVYKMQGEAEALRQAPLLFELKKRESDASIAASRASAAAAGASAAATRQRMEMTQKEFEDEQARLAAMKEWAAKNYPDIPFGAIDTASKYLNYEAGKDELDWTRSLRPDQRTQMYLDIKAKEQAMEQDRKRHEADMRRIAREESDWSGKRLQDFRPFDAASVFQSKGDIENAYNYYETERTIKELDDQISTLGRMIEANFGGTPQQVQDYNTLLSKRQNAEVARSALQENARKLINPNATTAPAGTTLSPTAPADTGESNSIGSSLTDWFKYSPILVTP